MAGFLLLRRDFYLAFEPFFCRAPKLIRRRRRFWFPTTHPSWRPCPKTNEKCIEKASRDAAANEAAAHSQRG